MGNCCTASIDNDHRLYEELELRRITARKENCRRREEMFASDPTLSGLHRDQLVDIEKRRVLSRCHLLAPQDLAEEFYSHVTFFVRDDDSYYCPSGSEVHDAGKPALVSPVVQTSGCFPRYDSVETLDSEGTPRSGGNNSSLSCSGSARSDSNSGQSCSYQRRLRFIPVPQIIWLESSLNVPED